MTSDKLWTAVKAGILTRFTAQGKCIVYTERPSQLQQQV